MTSNMISEKAHVILRTPYRYSYVALKVQFDSCVRHKKMRSYVVYACYQRRLTLSSICFNNMLIVSFAQVHDDVIKWKHFSRYWPSVRGIHRSPVNSPHKGQWRGALMFSLICAWIYRRVNNRETGDLRRYRTHHDVFVMWTICAHFKIPNFWSWFITQEVIS